MDFKKNLSPKEALKLVPPKPPGPILINESRGHWCPECRSSRAYGGFLNLFPKNGCINPNCKNYYK